MTSKNFRWCFPARYWRSFTAVVPPRQSQDQ
jgi:hypothetical protein